jgi:hypothetical protein
MHLLTTFRLAAGADESAFRAADRRVQTELAYQEDGLLRRTTARSDDGTWMVLEIWRSDADADAGAAHRDGHAAQEGFLAAVDPATVRRTRFHTLD